MTVETTLPKTRQECNILIDHLLYANYKWNRVYSPQIPVEWYKTIFSNVDQMEAKFQEELRK